MPSPIRLIGRPTAPKRMSPEAVEMAGRRRSYYKMGLPDPLTIPPAQKLPGIKPIANPGNVMNATLRPSEVGGAEQTDVLLRWLSKMLEVYNSDRPGSR